MIRRGKIEMKEMGVFKINKKHLFPALTIYYNKNENQGTG